MELKVNPEPRRLFEALGVSDERGNHLFDSAKEWLKNEIRNAKGNDLDKLDFYKYCASICDDIQEYTLLLTKSELVIEHAIKEVHEETCPRCKARKESEERRERGGRAGRFAGFGFSGRMSGSMPGVEQIAPGVFVISLS